MSREELASAVLDISQKAKNTELKIEGEELVMRCHEPKITLKRLRPACVSYYYQVIFQD